MSAISYAIPVGSERQYFDQITSGRFVIQQCEDCKKFFFPPREFCTHCDSQQTHWVEPSGLGTVYSHTTVSRKREHGGDYNIVLIDLDEGPRLMSTVIGTGSRQVHIGMRVQAFVEVSETQARVVFEEAKE